MILPTTPGVQTHPSGLQVALMSPHVVGSKCEDSKSVTAAACLG